MVFPKNSYRQCFIRSLNIRRLYRAMPFMVGLALLYLLFRISPTSLTETLLLHYGTVTKLRPANQSEKVRDFNMVNPVTQRCSSRGGRLLILYGGGLGNLMFQYASSFAIARRIGMVAILPDFSKLPSIFELNPDSVLAIPLRNYTKIQESHGCAFDPSLFDVTCGHELFLCCYLQSWKYIKGYETEIRSQFAFNSRVKNISQFYWDTVVLPAANRKGTEVIFIAVHVRRGDKASNPTFIANGNTVATKDYLLNGYNFFLQKFGGVERLYNSSTNRSNSFHDFSHSGSKSSIKLLFVVCSDDLRWARQVLPHDLSVFVDSGVPEVDMAVLSRCNHTLMTVGTFGWWVSWLVDGVTVYYKHMFKPGTYLAKQFNNSLDDWALPNWIPME